MNKDSPPASMLGWLERSYPDGSTAPDRITTTQKGEMDVRGKWTSFNAETIYRRNPFSFSWTARLNINNLMWVIAEDGHDSSQGWGGARLWGFIPMGRQEGPQVFAMQMIRSLAELPWYPQLATALTGLVWSDWDKGFAVQLETVGQTFNVRFELNKDNDIIRASSERNFDIPEGFVLWPWQYDFSNHEEINGVRIPLKAAATYHRPDGPWEYWRAKITSIEK